MGILNGHKKEDYMIGELFYTDPGWATPDHGLPHKSCYIKVLYAYDDNEIYMEFDPGKICAFFNTTQWSYF